MVCKTRNMDNEERLAAAHELELKHEKHIHQAQLVTKDEDTRRQKVTKQVLLDENSTLREQLAEKDSQINKLTDTCDETRAELESLKATNRDQQTQLKSQTRESANMKAELESLNSLSNESTKVLSEKLALSRELNALRPEVEHLRSQVAHHQTTIAEKLALEREVNTLEVQLAAEKRAKEQQAAQAEGNKTVEDELKGKLKDAEKKLTAEKREKEQLQQQLESANTAAQSNAGIQQVEKDLKKKLQEMEKMLVAERREKERVRKDGEVALSEAQAQQEMLEQRLDTLKSKLRNTQEELKAMRSEVVHTTTVPTAKPAAVPRGGASKAQNARKRRVEELSMSDMSIGTPEDIARNRRQLKKKGLEQTLVGEKSMFSITPFLAKSKTLSVEDAIAEGQEGEDDEADVSYVPLAHASAQKAAAEAEAASEADAEIAPEAEVATEQPEEPSAAPKMSTAKSKTKTDGEPKKTRGRPKKALAEASPNMPTQAVAAGKPSAKSSSPLDKVVEEEVNERENAVLAKAAAAEKKTAAATAPAPAVRDQEAKRKKRKLAGDSTTLFDDDGEGEAPNMKKPGSKVAIAGKGLSKTHLTMARNAGAFGKRTFSPLKKDRRGVGASFLA